MYVHAVLPEVTTGYAVGQGSDEGGGVYGNFPHMARTTCSSRSPRLCFLLMGGGFVYLAFSLPD